MIRPFSTMQAPSRFPAGILSLAILLSAALLGSGCRGKNSPVIQNDEGEPAAQSTLLSALRMNDAEAPAQLLKGFYGIENGTWRWTAGDFSVVLKTPPGAAQKGGALTFALSIGDALLKQVHSQTLTLAIGGKTVKTETYTEPGNHTFSADIPASALAADKVTLDFNVDHTLPPGSPDRRQLGVIALSLDLESK